MQGPPGECSCADERQYRDLGRGGYGGHGGGYKKVKVKYVPGPAGKAGETGYAGHKGSHPNSQKLLNNQVLY